MKKLLQEKISLKNLSHYKIGGSVEYFLDFENVDELRNGLIEWKENTENNSLDPNNITIMGEGTNILFNDEYFHGLAIRNSMKYIRSNNESVEIGAGTAILDINDFCIKNAMSGLEWAGGLPGTFGGAIFGNAGAFGGEIKDIIKDVTSYDINTNEILIRNNEECQFSYRNSIFKKLGNKEIILFATLKLKKGNQAEIRKSIEDKSNYRINRQPLEYPNIGSIFKNLDLKLASKDLIDKCHEQIKTDPFPVIPAAYLISLAGLKGKKIGGAKISEKHPNFIINLGNAKSTDVKALIKLVQAELKNKFGVSLETEVIIRD